MNKLVSHNEENRALFGDEDHLQVSQQNSFSQMIFGTLSGQTPTENQLKIFDLILNLSIDHGPDTSSAKTVIESAKQGKAISESVAEGIKQINDSHGGAIEPAMRLIYKVKGQELNIKDVVKEYLSQDKRVPGFGHRIYKEIDPRAELILSKLTESRSSDECLRIARDLEVELEHQKGQKLVLNIDGAIAVVLCTWGWEARVGKAVFIVARTPGLCGQYLNTVV